MNWPQRQEGRKYNWRLESSDKTSNSSHQAGTSAHSFQHQHQNSLQLIELVHDSEGGSDVLLLALLLASFCTSSTLLPVVAASVRLDMLNLMGVDVPPGLVISGVWPVLMLEVGEVDESIIGSEDFKLDSFLLATFIWTGGLEALRACGWFAGACDGVGCGAESAG